MWLRFGEKDKKREAFQLEERANEVIIIYVD